MLRPAVTWMRCCLAFLGLGLACLAQAAEPPMAPDFALRSLDGGNYRLSEYRGEVVAVLFWASWSGGSREQLVLLRDLRRVYADWGLEVLAVTLDERPAVASSVTAGLGLGYPVLQDTDKSVSRRWGPPGLPATYLVDRSGALRFAQVAGDALPDRKALAERVRALLDE